MFIIIFLSINCQSYEKIAEAAQKNTEKLVCFFGKV